MATAAITLSLDDRCQVVTTTDALLTMVTVPPTIGVVTVQVTSAAPALLQTEGAVQGAAPSTASLSLSAGASVPISGADCGVGPNSAYTFGVARDGATNAVIKILGSVR